MKNIEMFFVLAIALFFFFIYMLLSADPTFGLRQTVNLFAIFGLICALGTLLIRRVTRKKAGTPEKGLTYLNLGLDSDATGKANEIEKAEEDRPKSSETK